MSHGNFFLCHQHSRLEDVQYTTDSGANLTLKDDVSDARFPVLSVFRMAAAGCVVHFKKKGTASWNSRTAVASGGSRAETPSATGQEG